MFNFNFKREKKIDETSEFQRHYTGNWIWRAVAALVGEEETTHPPQWYSVRLGVTDDDVKMALYGLEKLGILKRTTKGYKRVLKYVYFSDRNLNPTQLISDHVLISSQILSRLSPSKEHTNFYRTSFVGTTAEKAKEFCARMEALMKEFLVSSPQSASDTVFALSVSLIDVTNAPDAPTEKKNEIPS